MRLESRERFPRHRLQRKPLGSDPGVHHARAVMHVGIANNRWRGKRSRHSRCMCNPQFFASGKRPMVPQRLILIHEIMYPRYSYYIETWLGYCMLEMKAMDNVLLCTTQSEHDTVKWIGTVAIGYPSKFHSCCKFSLAQNFPQLSNYQIFYKFCIEHSSNIDVNKA